ncbi:uncharacterized protein LY89DRAFT_683008 [Mollisia scopiformis]|uniref:Uncharacterized protein n=1 Tax=Mollisia scopiformis TaxID=149040 RepID=A0A194XFS1_MOLSC|nr:uncharacterized protein LY89DRAFT_683008 [Mollisia scopiformis]KUJ19045.1 hypothetical protein LY89DRAFT_683008 [Mollisia scopiformis]
MAPLDDAEQYFGKPGEIIVCGLSGARTYPRMGNQNQQTPESPRTVEMRYPPSPPVSQRNSGYGSVAGSYQQSSPSRYEAPEQYPSYTNQATYGQSSAGSSYSSPRQYPAKSQGFYESSSSSRYY